MTREDDRHGARPERRIEPRIDWARSVPDSPSHRTSTAVPAWRDRRHWRWGLLALVLLVALLAVARRPLADALWPDTRIQQLLEQADAAIRRGHLDAADGSGARQLYEAARALDSDRTEAVTGLRRVAQAAIVEAGEAVQENRFEDARRQLALARELQVPRAQADALAARLRGREVEHSGIEGLLQAATQAHVSGRLVGGDDAALALYQRVLSLQPTRLEALEGREDALSDLLQAAQTDIARGGLAAAAATITQVRGYDAGHVDLPQAQSALARAVDDRRRQAARDLARGRLAAAQAGYQEVLAVAPEDAAARQGLEQVGVAHARDAEQQAADFRFDQAMQALAQARVLAPQSGRVALAEQAVARARQAHARLDSPLPARERARRVRALLEAMATAEQQGHWLTPPGESAYDRLRAAQALAPDDAGVRRAAARALPAVRGCFEDELRGNRVRRAQACQQAWQTLQPRDPALSDARRRLAEKWIAVGTERLGAGDVAFAAQALQEARSLDGAVTGLDDFAARVRGAQAVVAP